MPDFRDVIHILPPDSSQEYILPNTAYKIVIAGTSTIVKSGTSDANGNVIIDSLASGHYDLIVNNEIVHSFHHITHSDYTKYPETWIWHEAGSISANSDESADIPVFAPGIEGKIVRLSVAIEHIDATGDITVHLLKGAAAGASALTIASDSVKSHRAYPQAEQYRYSSGSIVISPDIIVQSDQAVTIGWSYAGGIVEGLSVKAVFKPT